MKIALSLLTAAAITGMGILGISCRAKPQTGTASYLEKSSLSDSDQQLLQKLTYSPEKTTAQDLESLCKMGLALDPNAPFYTTIMPNAALIMALSPVTNESLRAQYSKLGTKMLDPSNTGPNMLIYGITLIKKSKDSSKIALIEKYLNDPDPVVREKALKALEELKK
ncbi:MAG: HEAT repeat domain-containing protein [Armatimonas sp.]